MAPAKALQFSTVVSGTQSRSPVTRVAPWRVAAEPPYDEVVDAVSVDEVDFLDAPKAGPRRQRRGRRRRGGGALLIDAKGLVSPIRGSR